MWGTLKSSENTLRPSSQHKGDLFAAEGQRTRNKRQRQKIEDEGEREGKKGKGKRVFVGCLWLEQRQMGTISKWWFIKMKGETLW